MSVLRRVKLRTPDGIESIEYPLGVDAENVEVANGENLSQRLARIDEDLENNEEDIATVNEIAGTNKQNIGAAEIRIDALERRSMSVDKKPYYFDTVADMKAYQGLKAGDMAITLGYYEANDGGGSEFYITDIEPINQYYKLTKNNLYAILLIKNNTLNIKQIGGRSQDILNNKYDIKLYIEEYINLLKKCNNRIKLYIPSGIWYTSPVDLTSELGFDIEGDPGFIINEGNGTLISSFNNYQDYIFNIGNNTLYTTNFILKNIIFTSSDFIYSNNKFNLGIKKYINNYCVNMLYCQFGITDNLFFQHINGKCLNISSSWEIYFNLLNFRDVNAINSSILCFATRDTTLKDSANITACNFEKIMFEQCLGDLMEFQQRCRFSNCHFGIINFEDNKINREGVNYTTLTDENILDFENSNPVHQAVISLPTESCDLIAIIEAIQLNNFSCWYATFNNINYCYDRIIKVNEKFSNLSLIINNIDVKGMNKNADIIYSYNNVYQYSSLIVNNVNNTSSKDFIFNVDNFPYIRCNSRIKGIKSTINYNLLNTMTPCYKLVNNRITGDRFLKYDNSSSNDLNLIIKELSTATPISFYLGSYSLSINAKIPNGETAILSISGVHSQQLTLEGTGNYKIYTFTIGSQFEIGNIMNLSLSSNNTASSCYIDYIIN